jgi:hypothetical protein
MNMNDITIGDLLVIIAGLTTIIGFITKVMSPYTDLRKRIEKVEEHQANDLERLKIMENDMRMMLKATRVLVAHSVTNNNTGELKKVQAEMDDYLINK